MSLPFPAPARIRSCLTGCLAVALHCLFLACLQANEFAITQFDSAGRLTFTEVSGASSYRVEWSATMAPGSWSSQPPGIASVPAQGPGQRTVTVGTGRGPSFFRVVALLQALPPAGFALIPEGSFLMGDSFSEGFENERPVHSVQISAFYLQKKEVTQAEWDEVRVWAVANGYSFDYSSPPDKPDSPVANINWYDAVKWCNARSQKEGLVPCYYTDTARTVVYRTGRSELTNDRVLWSASGYRLPTEAEWEKAARGGLHGQRFPWGNTITHSQANYNSSTTGFAYDITPTPGYHPDYSTGSLPYSSPVGSFAPNAYGLYDMMGNVLEWCWDAYDAAYYSKSPASDPQGAAPDIYRIQRGGSWAVDAVFGRVAFRFPALPLRVTNNQGFRLARKL